MHTDASLTPELRRRAALRLAFGVTVVVVLAQTLSWPIAFPAAVFAAILLQAPQPLSPMKGLRVLIAGAAGLLLGLAIAFFLMPYPFVVSLVLCLAVFTIFMALFRGAMLLTVVFFLVGVLVLPALVQQAPEIPLVAAWGLWIGLFVALITSWIMFLIFPSPPRPNPTPSSGGAASPDCWPMALTVTLVLAPLMLANLAFGWGLILMLIYSGFIALAASAGNSWKASQTILLANLLGAFGAIVAYELVVAAPNLPFVIALTLAAILMFSERIFSGAPSGAIWSSALNGFLILFGGSIAPFGEDTDVKALDRILQILLAGGYVFLAYSIIDAVRGLRRPKTGSNAVQ